MKKKMTEMVCILDQSGSMYGKEKTMIENYNQMIDHQKTQEGEAYITTALFCDFCEVLYSHTTIQQVPEMTGKDYYTTGNTALYDAIGAVFCQVEGILQEHKEEYEEKVLVFIMTDGMENASRQFNKIQIQQLIDEKQKTGWKILFFGTNMEVLDLAKDIGVKEQNTIAYTNDLEGISFSYEYAGNIFTELRR